MKAINTFILLLILPMAASAAKTPGRELNSTTKEKLYTVCTFKSGDIGEIKYRGASHLQAREITAQTCLRARVDLFKRKRGKRPTVDRKILFAEDCVNKTYCR